MTSGIDFGAMRSSRARRVRFVCPLAFQLVPYRRRRGDFVRDCKVTYSKTAYSLDDRAKNKKLSRKTNLVKDPFIEYQ